MEIKIKEGINSSFFHDDFFCDQDTSSLKASCVGYWLDEHRLTPKENNKIMSHDFGIDYFIFANNNKMFFKNNGLSISWKKGFDILDYQIACAYLDGNDDYVGVFKLTDSELSFIKPYFSNKLELYKFLYSPLINIHSNFKFPYSKENFSLPAIFYLSVEINKATYKNELSFSKLIKSDIMSFEDYYKNKINYIKKYLDEEIEKNKIKINSDF